MALFSEHIVGFCLRYDTLDIIHIITFVLEDLVGFHRILFLRSFATEDD